MPSLCVGLTTCLEGLPLVWFDHLSRRTPLAAPSRGSGAAQAGARAAAGLGGDGAGESLLQYGLNSCEASPDPSSWVNRIDIVPAAAAADSAGPAPEAFHLLEQVGEGLGERNCIERDCSRDGKICGAIEWILANGLVVVSRALRPGEGGEGSGR